MNNKLEQFIEAYNQADEKIKALLDSDAIGLFCEKIIQKYPTELSAFKSSLVVNTANRLLDVIDKTELGSEIKVLNLNSDITESIIKEIEIFTLNNQVVIKNESSSENLSVVTKVENTTKETSHIRTMAQDIKANHSDEEVVYSSTQAAILNEAKPKTESPSVAWGSEDK